METEEVGAADRGGEDPVLGVQVAACVGQRVGEAHVAVVVPHRRAKERVKRYEMPQTAGAARLFVPCFRWFENSVVEVFRLPGYGALCIQQGKNMHIKKS